MVGIGASKRRLGCVIAVLAAALALGGSTASALTTLTVNTTSDASTAPGCTGGPCSLRQAIAVANASTDPDGVDIIVPPGDYVLTQGALQLNPVSSETIGILGQGSRQVVVDAGKASRVLTATTGETLIEGMELTGGNGADPTMSGAGGAVYVGGNAQILFLNDTIDDNTASALGGGGIYSLGETDLTFSTVSDNLTSGAGGGVYSTNAGTLAVADSTIASNTATGQAGGVYADSSSDVTLAYSTIAGNVAARAAGLANAGAGVAIAIDTIIDGNLVPGSPSMESDCVGPVQSEGYNIDGDGTCSLTGTGDHPSVDPTVLALGPLQDNGGPTDTEEPAAGSPAIGAGMYCSGTDQRGVERPSSPAPCDIGAVEVAAGPTISSVSATPTNSTSAVIQATVNDAGQAATATAQYGTTTAYGLSASTSVPADASDQTVTIALSGLTAGTLYHVRLVLTSVAGTTSSSDQTFMPPSTTTTTTRTPPAKPTPPTATTGTASTPTTTSAAFAATVNPAGQLTTVVFQYGLTSAYGSTTTPQTLLAGTSAQSVAFTQTGLLPNSTYHYRVVASNPAGTTNGTDQVFKTPADPPPPPPVIAKAVNVMPVSGTVLIKYPNGAAAAAFEPAKWAIQAFGALSKGTGFIPLTEARQIPVGSQIDARKGTLALISAADVRHKTYNGNFSGAIFEILQARKQKALTTLKLMEGGFSGAPSFSSCATSGKGTPKKYGTRASIAAKSHLSTKVLQALAATAKGNFQTQGKFSSATVRGTSWWTGDRCDGTLTKVKRGVVAVRDFRQRKTIVLTAGHQYLAKAQ